MSRDPWNLLSSGKVLVTVLAAVLVALPARGQNDDALLSAEERECGSFFAHGRNGPSDYRGTARHRGSKLWLVEGAHFTDGIRTLTKEATGPFGVDLDYTLYSFPNHIPALLVMDRLGESLKADIPKGASHSVECYYRRALRFVPNDLLVRVAYADFLRRKGRKDDAMGQLAYAAGSARAARDSDDYSFTHYNIGLVYTDLKAYDLALEQAHIALSLGFTRPELKNRLMMANHWREPAPTGETAPAPAASAASQ